MPTGLQGLPPPPSGQTGISPDQFSHLPPPPKGQQGMSLAQIQGGQTPSQSQGGGLWSTLGNIAGGIVDVGLPIAGGVVGGLAGAVGGGLPSLGFGAPVGAVAGAGIGATAGTALANVFDQLTGRRQPTVAQAIGEPLLMGAATAASGGASQALGGLTGFNGLAARTAAQGAIGSGFGASSAALHGQDVGTGAAWGGVLGAGANVAGEGLNQFFGNVKSGGLPKDLTEEALPKISPGAATKNPAETIMNYKPGGVDSLLSQAQGKISSIQSKIEPLLQQADSLTSVGSPVTGEGFVSRVLGEYPNSNFDEKTLQGAMQSLAPDQGKLVDKLFTEGLSNVEADTLKKALYANSRIARVYNMQVPNPSFTADLGTTMSSTLANMVKENVPESAPLFAEQGQHITARNLLDKLAQQKGAKALSFRSLLTFAGGSVLGGPAIGIPAAIAERAWENPSTKLIAGNLLNRIGQSGAYQVAGQASIPARYQLLQNLLNSSPNGSSSSQTTPQSQVR